VLTVSGIAHCPVTGTALRPHYLLGVHVGLPSGTVRVSYNFVYISCPHVLRDYSIHLFVFGFAIVLPFWEETTVTQLCWEASSSGLLMYDSPCMLYFKMSCVYCC